MRKRIEKLLASKKSATATSAAASADEGEPTHHLLSSASESSPGGAASPDAASPSAGTATQALEAADADRGCMRLAPGLPVDVTFYRRFLRCMSADKPGKVYTPPLKWSPWNDGPPSSKAPTLPVPIMKVPLQPLLEPLSPKQIKELLEAKSSITKGFLSAFGKKPQEPYWAVGVEYEQRWHYAGAHRGRLVGTVPLGLYPATKEVTVRSWERLVERRVLSESLEEARTTDISGTERWSIAAKKQIVRTTNSTFNPSATLNSITIPAGEVPIVAGGAFGVSGSSQSGSQNVIDAGSEFIADATFKAVESIKNARTTTVETTREVGREETGRESLSNPNRFNTLTYLYYEVIEDFEIQVAPGAVDLFLFVPLPLESTITPGWLVASECYLRPAVPCDRLRAGFDAARRLLSIEKARQLRVSGTKGTDGGSSGDGGSAGGTSAPDVDLAEVLAAGDTVVATYKRLSGADQTAQGAGSWLYWECLKLVSGNLQRALETLAERWEANAFDRTDRVAVHSALLEFEADIGDVNAEFLKVNAAIAVCTGGALAATGLLAVIVVQILALVAALEFLGIDTVPDDRGLQAKVNALLSKRRGILDPVMMAASPLAAAATAAASGGGGDGATTELASMQMALQLRREHELLDEVEAQVEVDALVQHVFDNIHHYHQILWSNYDSNRILLLLQELGLPTGLFELRFHAFELNYGALRVVDLAGVVDLGIRPQSFHSWRKDVLLKAPPRRTTVSVPTGGVIVEPYLGQCQGGDEFVRRHRDFDLAQAEASLRSAQARADQAEAEASRLRARIDAGLLGDPTPFGRASVLNVEVELPVTDGLHIGGSPADSSSSAVTPGDSSGGSAPTAPDT